MHAITFSITYQYSLIHACKRTHKTESRDDTATYNIACDNAQI